MAFATWREAFLFIPLIGLVILIAQLIIGTRKNHQKVNAWIINNQMTPPVTESLNHQVETSSVWSNAASCLKNRNCQLAILLIFGFTWAEMGIANFLTLQLTCEVGLDLSTAAVISGASGLTGWIGQILWGSFSDVKGRKRSLGIIISGWILAAALCMFIHSATLAWAILILWGLFRNSPYPVAYALLIDSSPRAAASSMGLMIGLAVGIAGILVAPVSGWIISSYGFTAHYLVIVAVLLISCAPLWFIKETVKVNKA